MASTQQQLSDDNGWLSYTTWKDPGDAAFDLRSDTVTKPTASMLKAISQAQLGDDVFGEDKTTNALEEYVAKITGHQSGLFVMSGTMGNQIAIRTHLDQPPYSVLCDHRSHIIRSEAGGVSMWTGATVYPVVPRNGLYLSLEDIREHFIPGANIPYGFTQTTKRGHFTEAVPRTNVHDCPTRLISLENTLGGVIMPYFETKRIVKWAHDNNIKVHLDGARIWEAAAAVEAGGGSLAYYCSLFDSVSLCFSKGLGAPIGSMVVGSEAFIEQARWFRKSIGGGTRQLGVLSAAARVAVEEVFGQGPIGLGGKLKATHEKAKRVADMWTSRGGKLALPVQTNMVWLDLAQAGLGPNDVSEVAAHNGLQLRGGRIVIHHQISDDAIYRLEKVFDIVLSGEFERSKNISKPYGSLN
ncbi:putative low-specificity L-threonine aldolase 1 [Paecilomyces lecythidis]|uniref:Low-specificity L-threonine aldolase 1 n=1 Tax=Paecilomyces lecythidis TaxID=3004212 RepID=A0ABR3XTQ7_9EURO